MVLLTASLLLLTQQVSKGSIHVMVCWVCLVEQLPAATATADEVEVVASGIQALIQL